LLFQDYDCSIYALKYGPSQQLVCIPGMHMLKGNVVCKAYDGFAACLSFLQRLMPLLPLLPQRLKCADWMLLAPYAVLRERAPLLADALMWRWLCLGVFSEFVNAPSVDCREKRDRATIRSTAFAQVVERMLLNASTTGSVNLNATTLFDLCR